MQYTPHYNLNLPEGTDIVNPLVQDNPNYSAIDTALYGNKLRVVGTATHVKTGTNHAITLGDSDINQFKFVATGDYATGDTFTVDGVTVTPRIADGSSIPNGAFKINSTVLCILDGTILNLINVDGEIVIDPDNIILSNGVSVEDAILPGSVSITADGVKTHEQLFDELYALIDSSKVSRKSQLVSGPIVYNMSATAPGHYYLACPLYLSTSSFDASMIDLKPSQSRLIDFVISSSIVINNQSSTVPELGKVITFYY